MKKPVKTIEIGLIPNDFKEASFTTPTRCALANAIKRVFKLKREDSLVSVGVDGVLIIGKDYLIKNSFNSEDYFFVRDQYLKDPEMQDTQYFVTLIKIN